MVTKSFNKANLAELRKELNSVLEKYGVESGLDFVVGNMKYMETTVTITLEATIKGEKNKSEITLERYSEFKSGDEVLIPNLGKCTIVGYNLRSYKFPYVVKTAAGKTYKVNEKSLKKL